ncbi:MAG: acyl-CoA thioesterase [Bradyrhizobium sp.]|jgi:hypothetical protein|nr:acyl-CoA thioesterase [Bradyrhizobium sp.]
MRVETKENRAAIRRPLHARGIRTIEADGYALSALRSGLRQADGIHMTAEGHRRVAQQLAASIRCMSKRPPRLAASILLSAQRQRKRPQRGGGLRPVKIGGVYQCRFNAGRRG